MSHAIKFINESSTFDSLTSNRMQAWVIYYYGDNQQFTLSDCVQMPIIHSPTDVLVKIFASSLNPIDIRRRGKSRKQKYEYFVFLLPYNQKDMVIN